MWNNLLVWTPQCMTRGRGGGWVRGDSTVLRGERGAETKSVNASMAQEQNPTATGAQRKSTPSPRAWVRLCLRAAPA